MASNLTKRLDRLERLLRERTAASTSPLYLRDGDAIPDGIAPERIVWIKRTFVDPPERPEDELPAPTQETAPAVERQQRRERLEYPNFGLA
jgi:hypothetical protein